MARVPKSLSIEQVASTDLVVLDYIVPVNTVTTATLVLTNASSVIIDVDIYINNVTSDFIFTNVKLPAGIGKNKRILALPDEKLNAGFTIKLQADSSEPFNVFLSGSEISDS